MDDLLATVIGLILEIFAEVGIELLLGGLADLSARGIHRLFRSMRPLGPVLATLLLVIVGYGAGLLSVVVMPHPLVHPTRFHGASLIVSPALTGICMALLGIGIRRRGKQSIKIENFGYGFAFAFGVAFVRWAMVR